MAKNTSNSTQTSSAKQTNVPLHQHHYFRTIVASFFGFLAISLVIPCALVIWLSSTLTNTDKFTATVSPLVGKPAVQNYVADKVTSTIIDSKDIPITDVATEILGAPATAGKTPEQLKTALSPVINQSIRQIVSSPNFAALWTSTNRDAHAKFLAALDKPGADVTLDLHPVVVGVIDELGKTKLSVIKEKLDIADDAGQVTVKGKELDNARHIYKLFKQSVIVIVLAALVFAVLSVLISVHHLKTLRRITLWVGIFTGLLALLLSAPSFVKVNKFDPSEQELAKAVAQTLLHGLVVSLIAISVSCLVICIGSKVYSMMKAHNSQPKPNLKNFR